jgi:hypothetical protein
MSVTSKWMFILIGNDRTGKTTIQKALVELLNGTHHERLASNQTYDVTHRYFLRKCRKFFVAGRSYQELRGKPNEYESVEQYFDRKFGDAYHKCNFGFMASHLDAVVIGEMIREVHRRFWNACAVFLTNSISAKPQQNADISELTWDERWVAENAQSDESETQDRRLRRIAETMVQMLIERTRGW